MSPPETRSATKKPRGEAAAANGATGGGAFMMFSPPDQAANARREEQEKIARENDRYAIVASTSRASCARLSSFFCRCYL
jgi:hypothetical protein